MRRASGPKTKPSAEAAPKDIRRATRRQFSAEEKIRVGLEGLRGEDSIAELCRGEGTAIIVIPLVRTRSTASRLNASGNSRRRRPSPISRSSKVFRPYSKLPPNRGAITPPRRPHAR